MRDRIRCALAVYARMFAEDVGLGEDEVRAAGEAVGNTVGAWRPALVDEICGIAHGAGRPEGLLLALNARTELLAGGVVAGTPARQPVECSTVGLERTAASRSTVGLERTDASEPDRIVLAQTWDWHPDLDEARVLWQIERADGSSLTTFTEAGVLAKTGVSSRGLALSINFLASSLDGGTGGIPVHLLARAILEECETVDEVIGLIGAAPRTGSVALTVAACTGDWTSGRQLVTLELTPREIAIREPSGGKLIHTNHFLTALDGTGPAEVNSASRYEQLEDALLTVDPATAGPDELFELLASDNAEEPILRRPRHDDPWLEQWATLATVCYSLPSGRMWIRDALGDEPPVCVKHPSA